jgi:hypothetical protein
MGKETRKSFREDWIKRGFHLKTHCYARIIKKHHRKRVLDIHPEHPLKMKNNLPGMCLADNEMGVTTAIGIKCVRLRLTPTTTCKSKNGYGWSLWTASSFSNRRGNRVRDFAKQERERAKMDCLDEARHPLLHARPRPSASIAARARPKPPQTPATGRRTRSLLFRRRRRRGGGRKGATWRSGTSGRRKRGSSSSARPLMPPPRLPLSLGGTAVEGAAATRDLEGHSARDLHMELSGTWPHLWLGVLAASPVSISTSTVCVAAASPALLPYVVGDDNSAELMQQCSWKANALLPLQIA